MRPPGMSPAGALRFCRALRPGGARHGARRRGAAARIPPVDSLRHQAQWYALRSFVRSAQLLPIQHAYGLAAVVARTMFALGAKRRRYTLANLQIAFPDRAPAEL